MPRATRPVTVRHFFSPHGPMLQQAFEFFRGETGVLEHLVKKSRPDDLTRVHWNNRAPSVLMAEEMVAPSHPSSCEARTGEGGDQLTACDSGQPAHAATVTR